MRTASRVVVVLLAFAATSAATGAAQDDDGAEPVPKTVDLIVLGRQQLHATPDGFPSFCVANRERKRSELRTDVVTKLKAIADAGRPALIAALGDDVPVEPLWLVDDVYGFDFTNDTPELMDAETRQHGTLTSSLIVGDGTGGTVTGVAPRARLMAVRAYAGVYVAARAFQYAIENEVDVVNMSFSIPDLGQMRGLWRRMAENTTSAGVVLVSGAGNFRKQVEVPVQIRIPEGIPCVICVGGVTPKREVAPFSSIGPVEWESVADYGDFALPDGLIKPDLVAFPGPGLPLAGPGGENGYLPKNNGRRGNSLSAPQVTGTVALMLSANPDLVPWRVKEILEETARDILPEGKDVETGAGLLDTFAAVQRAVAIRDAAKDDE